MTTARVIQVSDTHLGVVEGRPPLWDALAAWLAARPPGLLVHTGDIVLEDPDDAADRRFAHGLVGELAAAADAPLAVIPGNHDVGFFDEPDRFSARIGAFRATWGDDCFVLDVGAWRLVGADSYRLGDAGHDSWLAASVSVERPVAVFVHQPVTGEPADGWQLPPAASVAFEAAVAGADLRIVASGHRHCAAIQRTASRTAVWAPSTRFVGDPGWAPADAEGVDPALGVVEHLFHDDGRHESTVVRPWPAELAERALEPGAGR